MLIDNIIKLGVFKYMKRFNTTGLCNPKKHYMVDISDKLEKIKVLIENEEYFLINRPRQYGKTTTLTALENSLNEKYLVIDISFEGTDEESFSNTKSFCRLFVALISESLEYIDEEINKKFKKISENIESLVDLSKAISRFIKIIDKEIILIIDQIIKYF